ncbi:MAG TPA: hypothetical protein VK040_08840 [Balneolaceae bacterium]|nr:hypothetical protein [Balneolaceae bacterium]
MGSNPQKDESLELGNGNGTGRRDGDLNRGKPPEQGGEDLKVKDCR